MGLNDFKANFSGGTRQNRFLIVGNFPNGDTTNTSYLHVRSTLIPTLQTSTISYDHFGRKHYYPGEKLYSTWSVSIYDDNSSVGSADALWKRFQNWHNNINAHTSNLTNTTYLTDPELYKVSWHVRHLDLNGSTLKTFVLNGLWPRTISEMSFNMARPNVLNTFNVVFVYDTITIPSVTDAGLTPQ